MPEAWTKLDPPTFMVVTPLGKPLKEGPGRILVYTGDSGGRNKDLRLRRFGWAWVRVGDQGRPSSGSYGNLVGPQTVSRAKLTALIELVRSLKEADHITEVEILSDSKMIVDRFHGGKERCMASKLWERWSVFREPYNRMKNPERRPLQLAK